LCEILLSLVGFCYPLESKPAWDRCTLLSLVAF